MTVNAAQAATHAIPGKVCLVTGANTGIGAVTARELARAGGHVFLACRSAEKTEPVVRQIREETGNDRVEFLPLDLGSLASVRACAEAFLARELPLHILINNAGLAGFRGLTKDGFEVTFGVNHLGHYLLTRLLLPTLEASAPSRIVHVASKAHYEMKGFDWEALRRPTKATTGLPEYRVSKAANVLFSNELSRRLAGKGVTTYALHPGVVASDVWRSVPWPFRSLMKLFMLDVDEGARTQLRCATAPELADETGLYYDACRQKEPDPIVHDEALARELWDRSAAWVGLDA